MDTLQKTEEPASPVDFKKEGIKLGLLNGLLALAILFTTYYIGFQTFYDSLLIDRFFPYMMIILIIAGLQIRKRNGGYLPFKDSIKFTFLSYVISGLMVAVGTYILYNLVDPNLTEKVYQANLEKLKALKTITPEDLTQVLQEAEKEKKETNFKNIFLGYGYSLIFDFMKCLLISILLRKEKPSFS